MVLGAWGLVLGAWGLGLGAWCLVLGEKEMIKTFRELEVWQYSMDLVEMIYRKVRTFPQDERFALCDQLRRAVVSIPSNIAEGFGRDTHKDFAHFLSQARGSLHEVDTQLEVAVRLGYMTPDSEIASNISSISKMLRALHAHLVTKHQAPGTNHQAPSTIHQAPSTKHQAP